MEEKASSSGTFPCVRSTRALGSWVDTPVAVIATAKGAITALAADGGDLVSLDWTSGDAKDELAVLKAPASGGEATTLGVAGRAPGSQHDAVHGSLAPGMLLVAITLAACSGAPELDERWAGGAGAPRAAASTVEAATARDAESVRPSVDVCDMVDLPAVKTAFGETGTLSTVPMEEANGPACGVPHPRQGGYLLVVQVQPFDRWERHAASGRSVDTLAHPAVETDASTLFVRDDDRRVVTMVLAPAGAAPPGAALRFASTLYPGRAR